MTQPAGPPPEKPTVELEKPPKWAISLAEDLHGMRGDVRELRADVGLISNDLGLVKDRLSNVERRADEHDKRADAASIRAKQPSEVDLAQASALAAEKVAREALALDVAKVKEDVATTKAETLAQSKVLKDIYDGATKLSQHPLVKVAVLVATVIATAWLSRHGIEVTK